LGDLREVGKPARRATWVRLLDDCVPAVIKPVPHELLRIEETINQHKLVISRQQDHLVNARPVRRAHREPHRTEAVWASVDKVAEEDEVPR
jgi:hypothetical protein